MSADVPKNTIVKVTFGAHLKEKQQRLARALNKLNIVIDSNNNDDFFLFKSLNRNKRRVTGGYLQR